MNFIVLLKQVPDISKIPPEAWDHQKGTLKRAVLDMVLNPLDLHALTLACRMREQMAGPDMKIVALTMGPHFAVEVIWEALARGADQGVLLTDPHFAGADTVATAFSLAAAIRKIEKEFFNGNKEYLVVCGVQSTDGDTAQVPPQIAEELGCDLIAYVEDFDINPSCSFRRIGPTRREKVSPQKFPAVLTVTDCLDPVYPSLARTRWARTAKEAYVTWKADDVQADRRRIGFEGSMTQVINIFSPQQDHPEECVFISDLDVLLEKIAGRLKNGSCPMRHSESPGSGTLQEPVKKDFETAPNKESAPVAHPPSRDALPGATCPWPEPRASTAILPRSEDRGSCCSSGPILSRRGEVWVFAEINDGLLAPVTMELLGKARELADALKQPVGAVLLGTDIRELSSDLLAHGADKVYVADHPQWQNFESTSFTRFLSQLVKDHSPQMVLFGATPLGRELAPRVSYATKAGLTADCTKLALGDYREHQAVLLQTRPALGGNIMATIVTRFPGIQMATVRPGVFGYPVPDPTRKGEVVECPCPVFSRTVDIAYIETLKRERSLSTAKVIVAGGAGLRSAENFNKYIIPLAGNLAEHFQLNVGVGASRRAVEMGIVDRAHQVGQTGQTVQPDVYFAIGISGAIQHISGMQKSSVIVAINPDPDAPIFRRADFGIVGRSEAVVPQLLERLALKRNSHNG